MTHVQRFAAQVLEQSATGYAAAAAHQLLTSDPAMSARHGAGALETWKSFIAQVLKELAVAVRYECPELFASGVDWRRSIFLAQQVESAELVAALECLRSILLAELPEHAREPVLRCLEAGLANLKTESPPSVSTLDPTAPADRLALRYIEACLEGERNRAAGIVLDEARRTLSDSQIYVSVLLPAQKEVGRLWRDGEISIAGEHIVSETTAQLAALLHGVAPRPGIDKTVLTAAVAGDAHEIGIRAVSDFFRWAGWRCIALGANTPAAAIASAALEFDVDLAALSAALVTHLPALEESIEALHRADSGIKVLVGGQAFSDAPRLWQTIGADAYAADPNEAVERGLELVGARRAEQGDR